MGQPFLIFALTPSSPPLPGERGRLSRFNFENSRLILYVGIISVLKSLPRGEGFRERLILKVGLE
jgi:hypothetical protein